MTCGSACTVSSDPSARTEPSCITVTWQSSERTKAMSCDDHRVVLDDLPQQRRRRFRLGVGHAGGGLVDKQQVRILH